MVSTAPKVVVSITTLWFSPNADDWRQALQRYWCFVKRKNIELERKLGELDIETLKGISPRDWYEFLHDQYFPWKYTSPNRLATTISQLKKYLNEGKLDELNGIRLDLLGVDRKDVSKALRTAKKIRGLGIAGASGLLSLMYPEHFATVDQFVAKALQQIRDLPEENELATIKNPQNLRIADGVLLTDILSRKAKDNNRAFGVTEWTPRKIDMVLWTYGRINDVKSSTSCA